MRQSHKLYLLQLYHFPVPHITSCSKLPEVHSQSYTPLIVDSLGIVQGSFYLLPSERKAWYNFIINKNDKEAIVS